MDEKVAVVEEAGEREKHGPEAVRKDEVKELGVPLCAEAAVMGLVGFSVGVGFHVGEAAEIPGKDAGCAISRADAGEDEVVCRALVK